MILEEVMNEKYNYDGELGAIYSKERTKFILWTPAAEEVRLIIYSKDGREYNSTPGNIVAMESKDNGTWQTELIGDLDGVFYNYIVTNNGISNEVIDPYAKAVGVNGDRGMVVDLSSANPEGFDNDIKPEFKDATDSILYEMHIRDFSINQNSGVEEKYRGKYSGVWQKHTKIPGTEESTCLQHVKELGVTHVHLLPTFDYASVDESKLDEPQFNWGYDPKNYNVPEGSYSINPYEGKLRINEFKTMVKELHKEGIRVVMDMVYNHTFKSIDSNFNFIAPGYYYRQDSNGNLSNGSACGNELASERYMVRRYIVDSVVYWAKEYHVDGFRFDLMALHDIETMKEIRRRLDEIDKSIIMYGEGWNGGESPLKFEEAAFKKNTVKYGDMQIAAFSDDARDGIKGNVFFADDKGFVNGKKGLEEVIKFTVTASTKHDGVDYSKLNYSEFPWANEPYQTVNYVSAHDNFTLWDKLQNTNPEASKDELIRMNKLAAAIVLTSQGLVFFQAGEEFARTKVNADGTLNENSYCSPDSVNYLDWDRCLEYKSLVEYYKGLIRLRKSHKVFRMNSSSEIREKLMFLNKGVHFNEDGVVGFVLNEINCNNNCNQIVVIYNANDESVDVDLKSNGWSLLVNEDKAGNEEIQYIEQDVINVKRKSCYVLIK
ncbi:type I pullulanase [Inconstantimicrobium mannanitabidum]|uniref:Uncharacterized protein n=1 Tax=Inconstantimicrobium mannanitabidum TaxID=1604901 RepID=A0ACB5RET9_9CLOT|nr:type I pullulanase [Clostridium sp. TW13]GKX67246.1 hypothetical protein rsdtw13_25040 [Clostridium sp. TW13]